MVSLLSRVSLQPKGKKAEFKIQLSELEHSLLIAWIQNEIAQAKQRHKDYALALKQEEFCGQIKDGKFKTDQLSQVKSINLKSSAGNYLLHCAASAGNVELTKAMLKKGAKRDLRNNADETAYDAAMNAKKYDLAALLLEKKEPVRAHEAIRALAQATGELRISSQADGRKTIKLKTRLFYDSKQIRTPEFTLPDRSKESFVFDWDRDNPLIHPEREGAVYDVVFTYDGFVPQESAGAKENEEKDSDDVNEPAEPESSHDDSVGAIFTGQLVSATDPEYKAPAVLENSESATSEENDTLPADEGEVLPPAEEQTEE